MPDFDLNLGEYFSEFKESKFYKILFILPIALLTFLFFTDYVVTISVSAASMVLSVIVAKAGTKMFGTEFFTLATVLTAVSFGGIVGGAIGMFLLLFHIAAVQLKGPYLSWVIPSYFFAGLLVPLIHSSNIFVTGVITIIGLQTFYLLMTAVFTPRGVSKFLPYALSNVVFNIVIFKFLAPALISAM